MKLGKPEAPVDAIYRREFITGENQKSSIAVMCFKIFLAVRKRI
jgi:hypothetical protein